MLGPRRKQAMGRAIARRRNALREAAERLALTAPLKSHYGLGEYRRVPFTVERGDLAADSLVLARLCPKRPARIIETIDDAGNFAEFLGYRHHLAGRFEDAGNLWLKVNGYKGLQNTSMTCSLQICCRIFGQFALPNHGLCRSRPRPVPHRVRT